MVDLDSEQLGSIGEHEVAANFARVGWGPIPNEKHDRGTDFVMQVRDARGAELPVFVGVQAKAGDSQFAEKVRDDDGELTGWWFRDAAGHHMRRWLNHSVPFLIVLHEIGTKISYWEHITPDNVHWTGKGAKIFVPITNVVDETSRDRLMRVADAQRVGTTWEGSIWRAGADVAPPDLLRHALIAPRLIALHPNAGTETPPSPEQAIAMLMLARLDELDRHAHKHAEVPQLDAVPDDADWRWRFAAALNALVKRDDLGPVQKRIADAPTPQARAAATVAAAAGRIQDQRVDEALVLLDDAIERAEPRSVDAAWLKVQRGRALVQVGRPADALDDLLDAQSARLEVPGDVTATGIAGAAVTSLFNIGPWRQKDLAALIEESDTATAWWRAQTTSYGLWKAADRAFDGWVRDRSIRIGETDTANNQLVAASLMATHVGDHGGWAALSAAVAKNTLIQLDRDADPGAVADALTSLCLAGDNKAVEAAVRRAVSDGPARAVTEAAKSINLDRSTRSTALADLTLLEHGGDVLDAPTATRTVKWLLATLKDPEAFVTRTRPTYALVNHLTETLAAVLPAAALDDHRAVIRHLCDLDPVEHQLDAMGWALVVAALPDSAWSDNDLVSVAATADAHHAQLRLALLGVAASRGAEAARVALLEEAKVGSLDAVAALADVRALPRDVVVAQIGRLADSVIGIVTDARGGKHGLAHRDPAHALILFNIWHPEDAVWEPVLDLLQEPAVVASNKRLALRLLVQMTERIPDAVGVRLAQIAASLARSSGSGPLDLFGGGSVSGQAALVAVALDALSTEETAQHLIRLLSGDRADRLMAATLAGREPKADHTGILAALAGDEVPDVRAAAAQGLARRLAGGDDSVLLLQALRAGLDDPGTLMASAIAVTLHNATEPTAMEFRKRLRTSPSAYVRSLGPAALSSD